MKKVLITICLLVGMILVQGCLENNLVSQDAIPDGTQKSSGVNSPNSSKSLQKNEFEGFRGIAWGTNFVDTNDPNMILRETSPDTLMTWYAKTNENLIIGASNLSTIHYLCYKNQLFSVSIKAEGFANYDALKLAIFTKYGKGYQSNRYIPDWYWSERRTDGKVQMMLTYNEIRKITSFDLFYKPIEEQKEKDAEETARRAGGDF